jgi:outer membrane protein assembly factor BamE (lipoprotein component of BamABCDE complex)
MNKLIETSVRLVAAVSLVLIVAGCKSAAEHADDVAAAQAADSNLTVGTVQKEIRVGMSGAEVAAVLGSPNIVTTDEQRREVWIYDKISTQRIHSASSGGVSALIFGGLIAGPGLVGGGAGGNYDESAGVAATSQKTLTVIIKYDEAGAVRDFAYHTSRF